MKIFKSDFFTAALFSCILIPNILILVLLNEAQNAYITINNREDWPNDIEQVYSHYDETIFWPKHFAY